MVGQWHKLSFRKKQASEEAGETTPTSMDIALVGSITSMIFFFFFFGETYFCELNTQYPNCSYVRVGPISIRKRSEYNFSVLIILIPMIYLT